MAIDNDSAFERVWEHREETIYPSLFGGPINRGTFTLTSELFADFFTQESYDPRWLFCGVLEFLPTEERNTWVYVTTGASNPWELESHEYSDSEYSGFGTEMVLEVPTQADWAIVILQRMLAYNILIAHDAYGDRSLIHYNHRIPLQAPITLRGESLVENLLVTKPGHYQSHFELESGRVDLLHFVGVTDGEIDFAKENSSDALCDRLLKAGFAPVTLPDRAELPNI